VSATSGTRAWAVGFYSTATGSRTLILRWNGTAWSKAASPNPASYSILRGVSARSETSAWAVGNYSPTTHNFRTLILRWNGTAWSKAASPNPVPGYDILFGVSATCGSNAWAVGYYLTASGSSRTLVLHWNGTSWSRT